MAVQTNGYPPLSPNVKPGLANGHAKAPQFSKPVQERKKKGGNPLRTAFGFFARIAIWYSLYTLVARCPSSPAGLTSSSPQICKPYATARSYIDPYVQPLYKSYAEPYVEKARPYFQKIDNQYLAPVVDISKQTYDSYGAPQVHKAQVMGRKQWDKKVKPQLDVVEKNVKATYDATVAPHIKVVSEAATPYYAKSREGVLSAYKQQILPTFFLVLPYAQQAYDYVYSFALDIAVPYAEWVWDQVSVWLARSALPKVKVLYGENVEPQLVRISERLGRYTDKRKLKAAVDAAGTEAKSEDAPEAANGSDVPSADSEELFQKIMDDLRVWQDKFAVAADKGSEDLHDRIKQITDKQIASQANTVGKSMITVLEETAKAAETSVKDATAGIVKGLPEDPSDAELESANGQLFAAVRAAGGIVKAEAEALGVWKQNYETETSQLVGDALQSTLDVIDNMRDLGLQELGMKWAWTDGVTYKHWAKFHELKKALEDWRTEIVDVAASHEGVAAAKSAGNDVHAQGMVIAEASAKELARLKEVGQWKIKARDAGDDYSNKYVPPAAVRGGQKVLRDAKSVVGAQKQQAESVASDVSASASSVASDISKSVVGSTGSVESIATKVSEAIIGTSSGILDSVSSAAARVASSASSVVAGEPSAFTDKVVSSASSIASEASESASSAGRKVWGGAMAVKVEAREIVLDDEPSVGERIERVAEQVGEQWEAATDSIANKFKASTPGAVESITSQAGSYAAAATDAAGQNYESLKAFISELVSGKEPDFTESVMSRFSSLYTQGVPAYYASATSAAGEAYGSAVSVAASIFTPPPALESILAAVSSQIDAAVDNASIQIYGTSTGRIESAASAAGDVYGSAASAASVAYSSAASAASDVYDTAASAAAGAYDSVQSYASEAVYGTPTGYVEAASSSIGNIAASASEALSIAIYGTPKGYVEQATSAVGEQYQGAASVVADSYAAVSSGVAANAAAVSSAAAANAAAAQKIIQDNAAAASSVLSENYEAGSSIVASRASEAYDTVSSAAVENAAAAQKIVQDNASAASSILSENYEAGSSVVASRAYDAASAASGAYSVASAKASEAIYGPELSAWESVQSRISAAIETAQARLNTIASDVGSGAAGAAEKAKENLESLKDQLSEAVLPKSTPTGKIAKVTKYLKEVKDEL